MSEGSEGMKKGIKYNQDQSSIMLLLELSFRHNAVVLRVTLKSIMLKSSSIMYLTPSFSLGIYNHVMYLDQSCESKTIN